jgi:hypothetical protein
MTFKGTTTQVPFYSSSAGRKGGFGFGTNNTDLVRYFSMLFFAKNSPYSSPPLAKIDFFLNFKELGSFELLLIGRSVDKDKTCQLIPLVVTHFLSQYL